MSKSRSRGIASGWHRSPDDMPHTGASSTTDPIPRFNEPEAQAALGEVIRETDKDMLEVSGEAVAARTHGIPGVPPHVERQKHRLVHLPCPSWCDFCVAGSEEKKVRGDAWRQIS